MMMRDDVASLVRSLGEHRPSTSNTMTCAFASTLHYAIRAVQCANPAQRGPRLLDLRTTRYAAFTRDCEAQFHVDPGIASRTTNSVRTCMRTNPDRHGSAGILGSIG